MLCLQVLHAAEKTTISQKPVGDKLAFVGHNGQNFAHVMDLDGFGFKVN